MKNGLFKLEMENIKSSLVYGLLWGLLAIVVYMVQVGDVFALNWREVLNAGIFGFLGIAVSLIKNLLTTAEGNFMGVTKVIPEIK